jgi:hypothetical protein
LEDQRERLHRTRALAEIYGSLRRCDRSDHKWFRSLAVSRIIAETMDDMGLKLPPTHVDIAAIRRKFHAAEREEKGLAKAVKDRAKNGAAAAAKA